MERLRIFSFSAKKSFAKESLEKDDFSKDAFYRSKGIVGRGDYTANILQTT